MCLVLYLASAGAALAQSTTALSGQVEVSRLLDLCAERLRVPIDYDAAAVKGATTLRAPDGLTDVELWNFTNRQLAARGLTTVRMTGAEGLSVVRTDAAAASARIEPEGPPAVPDAGYQSVTLRPRHRSAKELAEAIRPLLSKPGGSAQDLGIDAQSPGGGVVLLSDLTPRIEQARRLLDLLDTQGAPVEMFEVVPREVPPAVLAPLVHQLHEKQEAASGTKMRGDVIPAASGTSLLVVAPASERLYWQALITAADKREPVTTVTYSPRSFAIADVAQLLEKSIHEGSAADERWKLVEDELTGTLIISATPAQQARIAELIERLNTQPAAASRPVRAFPVRNRPVSELLDVLDRLIAAGGLEGDQLSDRATSSEVLRTIGEQRTGEPTGPVSGVPRDPARGAAPDSAPAGRVASGTSASPTSPWGDHEGLSLTADESTNTLIAIGESRVLAQLANLLEMLDVRQPQVMLEVMLVSLSESDSLNLGIELERIDEVGDATVKLSSLFGLSTAGPGVRVPLEGAGFNGAVLSPGEYSVIARAIENTSKGRSASYPKVLVNNNQLATFSSVLQQPFATTSSTTSNTTSGFGGTQDAGTTIAIRPQIAEGDHLVVEYSLSLSSFVGGPAGGGLPPPRQQNKVDSIATVPDGYAVVVGGLEFTNDSKGVNQVPAIGDIPLIGELFKSRSNSDGRQRFFVFIKASVLRDERLEDLRYISASYQAMTGVDDGVPDMLPRVIR